MVNGYLILIGIHFYDISPLKIQFLVLDSIENI